MELKKAVLVRDWRCAGCGSKVFLDGKNTLVCKCGEAHVELTNEDLARFYHIEVLKK